MSECMIWIVLRKLVNRLVFWIIREVKKVLIVVVILLVIMSLYWNWFPLEQLKQWLPIF